MLSGYGEGSKNNFIAKIYSAFKESHDIFSGILKNTQGHSAVFVLVLLTFLCMKIRNIVLDFSITIRSIFNNNKDVFYSIVGQKTELLKELWHRYLLCPTVGEKPPLKSSTAPCLWRFPTIPSYTYQDRPSNFSRPSPTSSYIFGHPKSDDVRLFLGLHPTSTMNDVKLYFN